MLATRILGYGKEYKAEITCKACGEKEDTDFDLAHYKYKEIDESKFSKWFNSQELFSFLKEKFDLIRP